MDSTILPAWSEPKSLLTLEYRNLLKSTNKIVIKIAVIIAKAERALSRRVSLHPNKTANSARVTSPTYPLNLSRRTVATTSRGLFVYVAKSMLRTKSPPIVEGRNKLKNAPPQNDMTTLFKGRWIWAPLSNISQRKRHRI